MKKNQALEQVGHQKMLPIYKQASSNIQSPDLNALMKSG